MVVIVLVHINMNALDLMQWLIITHQNLTFKGSQKALLLITIHDF
jgi:hypothetical protein